MQLSDLHSRQKLIKSVEIVPKRDFNIGDLLECREVFSDIADMMTAPENQMGKPGIDPLVALYILTQGTNVVAMPHITPRDKNSLYISSQILTSLKLGIKNFFVIAGDPISAERNIKEVREMDTNQTINHIRNIAMDMNQGSEVTIGGAFNPNRTAEEEIVRSKVNSGATMFISQMCYSSEPFKQKWIRDRKFKLSIGFMPILKKGRIKSLREMGVELPENVRSILENSENLRETSLKLIAALMDDLKGYVDGIHIMPLGNNGIAKEILEIL